MKTAGGVVCGYCGEAVCPANQSQFTWSQAQRRLVLAMNDNMMQNVHKGEWDRMPMSFLLRRLDVEMRELRKAIHKDKPVLDVEHEAAAVANFLMMIVDKYRPRRMKLERRK